MRRQLHASILALSSVLGLAVAGEPPAVPPAPPAAQPAPTAPPVLNGTIGQAEAEALCVAGTRAMQTSTEEPAQAVTAAIAFSQALRFFQAAGDIDRSCDLEANIFWCKKRMSADDLARYAARNQGDQAVASALATITAVATKTVPAAEATAYLERAERFAKDHPQDFAQQSVRYYEVAERFLGTDVSLAAQKLSLEAQGREMQRIKQEHDAERSTLFTRTQQAPSGVRVAPPTAEALRAAVVTVHQLYKDAYARSKPKDKRELAQRLLEQAPLTKDDPVTQYALLGEALELSLASSYWLGVLSACDLMARSFTGIDATAKKKEALAKAHGAPAALAMAKLLDDPLDADANAVAGRYFCCEAEAWDIGLPLLAHGGEREWAAVAAMEMLKPATGPQQAELGDRWFELVAKAPAPAKEALRERALHWYETAAPALTGITKARIDKRLEELRPVVAAAMGIPLGLMPTRTYVATWDMYHTTLVVKSASGTHGVMFLTTSWGTQSVTYEAPVTCDADGILQVEGKDAVVAGSGKGGYTPDSFRLLPKGALEQYDLSGHHTKGTYTLGK